MDREPTEYERQLMESLAFDKLQDLVDFMNLPPLPGLRMQPPQPEEPEWEEDD